MYFTEENKNAVLKKLDKHFIFTNNLLFDRITGLIQTNYQTIKEFLLLTENKRQKMKDKINSYNKENKDKVLFDLDEDVEDIIIKNEKITIIQELNNSDTSNGIIKNSSIKMENKDQKKTNNVGETVTDIGDSVLDVGETVTDIINPENIAEFIDKLAKTIIQLIKIIIRLVKIGGKFTEIFLIISPFVIITFVAISINNSL
jgi:hypothetical protein